MGIACSSVHCVNRCVNFVCALSSPPEPKGCPIRDGLKCFSEMSLTFTTGVLYLGQ